MLRNACIFAPIKCLFMKNHIKDMLNHITEADYQGLKPMLETIDDFARSSYQAIYIIDRYKDNSLFVSNCDNFFLHQSPEEVKAEGFEVILQHIYERRPRDGQRGVLRDPFGS